MVGLKRPRKNANAAVPPQPTMTPAQRILQRQWLTPAGTAATNSSTPQAVEVARPKPRAKKPKAKSPPPTISNIRVYTLVPPILSPIGSEEGEEGPRSKKPRSTEPEPQPEPEPEPQPEPEPEPQPEPEEAVFSQETESDLFESLKRWKGEHIAKINGSRRNIEMYNQEMETLRQRMCEVEAAREREMRRCDRLIAQGEKMKGIFNN